MKLKQKCLKCRKTFRGKGYMLTCNECAIVRAETMGVTVQTIRLHEKKEYQERRK